MEATFLQSRQAREENRAKSQALKSERTERVDAFWALFKQICAAWNDRLHQIQTESHENVTTEEHKRQVQWKLSELADELKELKRLCLSTSSLGNSPATDVQPGDERASGRQNIGLVLPLEDDLSATDVRLLHRELTQCQAALEAARHTLLPKGKFMFVRYRKALQLKQEQSVETPSDHHVPLAAHPTDTLPSVPSSLATENHIVQWQRERDQHTLQELSNMSLTVLSNGNVELVRNTSGDKNKGLSSPLLDTDRLVLRNLTKCTVTLLGSYKALHMVNVEQSTIVVPNAIQGAVHVTNCHSSSLTLCAQQLRLHTSTDLSCHCWLTAGAILEECRRIDFIPTSKSKSDVPHLDVKDFDWLRNDVPSPNFTIQPAVQVATETFTSTVPIATSNAAPIGDTVAEQSRPIHAVASDESNDTDDEL